MRGGRIAGLVAAFALAWWSSAAAGVAPSIDPGKPGSHREYLEQFGKERASGLAAILRRYDERAVHAPEDSVAATERCRFLDSRPVRRHFREVPESLRDECAGSLLGRFHYDADVRVFLVERESGEEAVVLGQQLLAESTVAKEPRHLAAVHAHLARNHSNKVRAGEHAAQAMAIEPDRDLRVVEARGLIEGKKTSEARDALVHGLEATKEDYQLDTKARLLVQIGAFEEAVVAYREMERRGETIYSPYEYARSLTATGRIDEARERYRAAAEGWSNDERNLRARFEFELEHGDASSARAAYDDLAAHDSDADVLGEMRIALLLAHPGAEWKGSDVRGFALLAAFVGMMALLPAVLFAPVTLLGRLRRRRHVAPPEAGPFRFGMRQARLAGAILVVALTFVFVIFPEALEPDADKQAEARAIACAMVVSFVGILAIARRELSAMLARGRWGILRSVVTGVLLMAVLTSSAFAIRHYSGMEPERDLQATTRAVSREVSERAGEMVGVEAGKAVALATVLLWVAVLVPLYEEVFFRGILLSAFQTQVPFGLANLLQAVLFGLMHGAPLESAATFLFGLAAGFVTMRSGSLRTGIFGHMLNNAIWCFAAVYGKST